MDLSPPAQHSPLHVVGELLANRHCCDAVMMLEKLLDPNKAVSDLFVPVRVGLVLLGAPSTDRCWQDLTDHAAGFSSLELSSVCVEGILVSAEYLATRVGRPDEAGQFELRLTQAASARHLGMTVTPAELNLRALAHETRAQRS